MRVCVYVSVIVCVCSIVCVRDTHLAEIPQLSVKQLTCAAHLTGWHNNKHILVWATTKKKKKHNVFR